MKLPHLNMNKILHLADEDGVIDFQEKKLLKELQHMIENKTVKRVPD